MISHIMLTVLKAYKGKVMNEKNFIPPQEQEELELSKWKLIAHIGLCFGFALPAGTGLYLSINEPKLANIIPTAACCTALGIYGAYDICKSAKSYIQLKKKYEKQI